MMGVYDSIELQMLRRAGCERAQAPQRLTCSQPQEMQSVHKLGWETAWAHSLLSLAFTT